jgi:hypothetical protein
MPDEDHEEKANTLEPFVPERTPKGRFVKGSGGGNPRGRPLQARGRFSKEYISDVVREWRAHGPEVLARARKENPVSFLAIVSRLVPQQYLLDMNKSADRMNDGELLLTLGSAIGRIQTALVKLRQLPGGGPIADEIAAALAGEPEQEQHVNGSGTSHVT